MSYICSEETKDLLSAVKEFCEKEVRPLCKEYDKTGEWPEELYEKAKEMQLHLLDMPEEYGGMGLDRLSIAVLYEEMAKADAGFAVTISTSGIGLNAVLMHGNEKQKKMVCDIISEGGFGGFALTEPEAGSDAGNGKTTAKKSGNEYILNGRKTFITNGGRAAFYVVTAMTDKSLGTKGMSAFIVKADTAGLSFGTHEDKMGIRGSATCDLVFDECRIPAENLITEEGMGFKIAMQTLDISRAYIGCLAVGIAERALEEAVQYAKTRIQFGKPIIKNQALAFKAADMKIKIETARAMVEHTCRLMDQGMDYGMESAVAKCYGGDIAMAVTTEAVQMFGGYGYIKEYPVEKLMRDAKIFQIFEGSNEIQRIVISGKVIASY